MWQGSPGMSNRSIWKMLHLLRLHARPDPVYSRVLTEGQLDDAGVDCIPDTIEPVLQSGAVESPAAGVYRLSAAARFVLDHCVVANRRWTSQDEFQVDAPSAFVVMPFSEPWSDTVWAGLIKPAIRRAGLRVVRGDMPVRVLDLANSVWDAIQSTGLIVADLSVPNPNVLYELGLAHALGKDTFVLKQRGTTLAADFGGAHYYEYALDDLECAQGKLTKALRDWKKDNKAAGVAALSGDGVRGSPRKKDRLGRYCG
jgi:hypothetical protein